VVTLGARRQAARNNRHGDRPYSDGRLRERIGELARRLDIRDTTGVLVDFQRTHRFRHTKATTLQIGGVAANASFDKISERFLPATSSFVANHGLGS